MVAIAAAAGLLLPDLYRDTAESVRQAQATDLVTLLAAVPSLTFGLWRASRGWARGRLIVLASLGYLAYSYAIYAFSVVINPMTPVHIAILGLATWAFVLGAIAPSGELATTMRVPRRTAAAFLLVVVLLFALLWLGAIALAITSGRLPLAVSDLNLPTSPVYALDLAFALPLLALAALRLLRRHPRGAENAMVALLFVVLLGLSVLAIFVFDVAPGRAVDIAPVLLFALVTAISAVLAGLGLRPIGGVPAMAATS